MINYGNSAAHEAAQGASARSSRKLAIIVFASLVSVATFVSPGTSVAASALSFVKNDLWSNSTVYSAPCRGDKPGFCPDSSLLRL